VGREGEGVEGARYVGDNCFGTATLPRQVHMGCGDCGFALVTFGHGAVVVIIAAADPPWDVASLDVHI
jgi:hypothetical protein